MRLFLILGTLLLLYCNECELTKTAVFIYDKVNATEYDVNQFTEKIKRFSSTLFEPDGDFDFHIKIVVPYKSYIQEVLKFNSTVAKVITRKNDTRIKDQSTLKSVLTQLQDSPSYSVIYVITNVTKPSNDIQLDSILEEIQIKRTQVNFLIETESCLGNDSLQEYGLISSASDGFAQMGPNLFKYRKVPTSVYMKLNSAPRKVCPLEIKHINVDRSCINMDSFFINAVVQELIFGSLDSNEYEINAVDRHRTETATGTSEICTDIYKKLNSAELQFVIAGYRGQHEFHYGFSTEDIESLNETFKRPIKGASNKIYVSSSYEYKKDQFQHFNVLFLNGTRFGRPRIPLRPINQTDLFVGSFEPPNEAYFYIQVISQDNWATVARISNAISAADGFGENEKNPIFEYKPVYFKPKPKPSIDQYFRNRDPEPTSSENDYTSVVLLLLGLVIACIVVVVIAAFIAGVSLIGFKVIWKFCKWVWDYIFGEKSLKPEIEKDRRHRAKPFDYHAV